MDPVFIAQVALVLVVFHALLLSAAAMVYAERKVAAWLQQRHGPIYTGPFGLLQPFADVFKLFFKEELRPAAADKILFYVAPALSAPFSPAETKRAVIADLGVHAPAAAPPLPPPRV